MNRGELLPQPKRKNNNMSSSAGNAVLCSSPKGSSSMGRTTLVPEMAAPLTAPLREQQSPDKLHAKYQSIT